MAGSLPLKLGCTLDSCGGTSGTQDIASCSSSPGTGNLEIVSLGEGGMSTCHSPVVTNFRQGARQSQS